MKAILKKYLVDSLSTMALGLFATLIAGSIIRQIGLLINIPSITPFLTTTLFDACKTMSGPMIAVAVGYGLKSDPLVLFATGVAGFIANDPISAWAAGIIGNLVGMLVSKKTKVDILVTPITTLISAGYIAYKIGPMMALVLQQFGEIIMWATTQQPFIMGMIVSVVVGIVLTLPISSAALCFILQLSGPAAGAATVGCCCQMIGFATMSYRENKWSGFIAQGLGTSMIQVPNIVKNPLIWLPTILASAILGPISIILFKMENLPYGAGMGTSGLVGQFGTIEAMGATPDVLLKILLLHFILPAIITLIFSEAMRKAKLIKPNDLKLPV